MRRLWILALPFLLGACGYNQIQTLDEQAASSQQQIEVQLQRRADLIPNLVATVKGYAAQEERIFTEVARAQAVLTGALARPNAGAGELAAANEGLTRALTPMLAFAQAYPNLKSDQQFIRLQDELAGTENRIAVARTDYNNAAQAYNTYIRKFPAVVTAKATGAQPREYFRVESAEARQAPKVDFGTPAPGAPPAGASSGGGKAP